MQAFEKEDYAVFDLFNNRWGLVTAGSIGRYNTCTIAWGSLGSIWGPPGKGRPIVTVYVNPERYTWNHLLESEAFTVSFFPPEYRPALGYLGSHSGRDGDKVAAAGLTPKAIGEGVTFEQAELTFLCHKLYEGPFEREGLAPEIDKGFYADWQPHWMFIGEITETQRK